MFESSLEQPFTGEAQSWCVSLDYGTQNAFHALKFALDKDSIWHCVDECRHSGRDELHQKTNLDYANDMVRFVEGIEDAVEFIVDPSAASFILELKRKGRYKVRGADNNIPEGIRDTAVCLQKGQVRISNKCKHLIKEFNGYVWDTGIREDLPVKANDHGMDALRYFVRTKRVRRKY